MARKGRGGGDHGGGGGHDGGGSMRWLLTYADMITLLMAFFIMLYSMSVLNLSKFQQVAISIKSGFGGLVDGQGKSILGSSGQFSVKPSPISGDTVGVSPQIMQRLTTLIKDVKNKNAISMRIDERGLVVSLVTDKVLFAKGQADLSPTAKVMLSNVASILGDTPNYIRIEGHTCNLPVVTEKFPSNWELSTTRATNVVRFLIDDKHIKSYRLSAAGYADSKPIVPNTCEENRAKNRRVDIVVLKTDYK